MANTGDNSAHTETAAEEQQPLLGPSKPPHYSLTITPAQDVVGEEDPSAVVEPPKQPRTRLEIAVKALVVLLAVFVLAVFVKGFIDADDVEFDLGGALKSALGGGLSGAAAMVLQVLTLMPLRTIMNYQYRYGTTTTEAIKILNADGGYPRFYQGLTAALVQGPVSRFGDTAANAGILALLQSNTYMRALPTLIKTVFASVAAACFRMILTPVDTVKTTLQTQGKSGIKLLRDRIKKYGIGTLWYGALATAAATFVGHYPWFGTYNYLDAVLPLPTTLIQKLFRSAFIGFVASVASDTISNSLRVLKTYRQVNATRISYTDAARAVIAADGVRGLLGRGLKTRILANGLQGLMFSVLWKLFMDILYPPKIWSGFVAFALMYKRKHRSSTSSYNRQETTSHTRTRSDESSPDFDPSLYLVAHEADIVSGPRAVSAALALQCPEGAPDGADKASVGSGLILLEPQHTLVFGDDGEDVKSPQGSTASAPLRVDRYDVRLLLDSLAPLDGAGVSRLASAGRPLSPSGWSDLPSDAEDTFFFSPEEIEDYRRDKRRRLLDRGREERMRAILEAERERGLNRDGEDSDVWGGSDEEPDEAQRELLRRTAAHVVSSPNPAQLEMRILANHGADKRFAFLRGRWSRAWRIAKEAARQQQRGAQEPKKAHPPPGGSSLKGLAGYGDSDDSGGESSDDDGPHDSRSQTKNDSDEEEARMKARREKARQWSARRRAEQI
ncbi:hypothetical protein ID866_5613 [Astraeus odoratus]|nr:hypothetical protein ID866_5613 [Astraeus odoratus]